MLCDKILFFVLLFVQSHGFVVTTRLPTKASFAAPLQASTSLPPPIYEKSAAEADFLRESLSFSELFEHDDGQGIETMIQAAEPVSYKNGAQICRQGQSGDFFYIIQSGSVEFTIDNHHVATLGPERCFGELALLTGGPRAATVTAYGLTDEEKETKLWRVDKETFLSVVSPNEEHNSAKEKTQVLEQFLKRVELKKRLQHAAIQSHYHVDPHAPCENCEQLMTELEQLRPITRTAYHPSMNGDWCMVRASANTLDMTLITIVSALSRFFNWAVDFTDFHLTLKNNATMVQGSIHLNLFGDIPFRVDTFTNMVKDDDIHDGTLMYEHFKGFKVSGIELDAPFLDISRPLNITYLDEDIMIARNGVNGEGDPHLLVRIQHCPESDPDHEYTGFFEEARQMYGQRMSRCLVDRCFGDFSEEAKINGLLEKAHSVGVSNTRDRLQWTDKK